MRTDGLAPLDKPHACNPAGKPDICNPSRLHSPSNASGKSRKRNACTAIDRKLAHQCKFGTPCPEAPLTACTLGSPDRCMRSPHRCAGHLCQGCQATRSRQQSTHETVDLPPVALPRPPLLVRNCGGILGLLWAGVASLRASGGGCPPT